MSIFGSSYRTYVLNDFSAVSKAAFYVMDATVTATGIECRGVVKKLPVQINPNKISGDIGESRNAYVEDMGTGREYLQSHKKAETDNKYEISLDYDIYDEYNVRTMNGLSNAGLLNDMSLFNEDTVTLEKLKMFSGNTYYVLFLWGDIQIFGNIENVSFSYTAFSRWGTPLKANATVTIRSRDLGFSFDGATGVRRTKPKPLDVIGGLGVTIQGDQAVENAITAAADIDALR